MIETCDSRVGGTRRLVVPFVIAGLLQLGVCASLGAEPKERSVDEASVTRFLQSMDDSPQRSRYLIAFEDLNSDGTEEAIAYLLGPSWCGSGGCTTLVLAKSGQSWRVVFRNYHHASTDTGPG